MPSISKSKLKANMLRIFREIEESGEEWIITDHNRPVLRIQPIVQKKTVAEVFGAIQGKVIYRADINMPTIDEWFPDGWNEERVQRLLQHYESQTEEEAVAEDEGVLEDTTQTVMEIPNALVPSVRALLSQHAE